MNTKSIVLAAVIASGTVALRSALAADPAAPATAAVTTPAASDKVGYLGVTTKVVDAATQAQLQLPEGVGLAVTFVDRKGPSAADIQPGDVLQKLDDQILIDAHQLVTLIHTHKGGDTVTVSLYREAKPMTVTIKLGEKARPPQPTAVSFDDANTAPFELPEVRALQSMPVPMPLDGQLPGAANSQVAMAFDDGTYSAQIETDKEGHRNMTVKDKDGKVVAQGPVDNEDQWNTFPQEVRSHLDVLHNMLNGKRQIRIITRPPGAAMPGAHTHVEVHTQTSTQEQN